MKPDAEQFQALVLLNGEPPSKDLLFSYWKSINYKICSDGAANLLAKLQLIPDVILGDFDSISEKAKSSFAEAILLEIEDQNTTDGEKACEYCLRKGFNSVAVFGALGERTDHALYNLNLLKKFKAKNLELFLVTDHEYLFLISGDYKLNVPVGTIVSFMPIFGQVEVATTRGLKYPIETSSMEMGGLTSLSNVVVKENASISISQGELVMIINKADSYF